MIRRSTSQKKIDDAAFPVRVRVVVPGYGLGPDLIAMRRWLSTEIGDADHTMHGASEAGGRHPRGVRARGAALRPPRRRPVGADLRAAQSRMGGGPEGREIPPSEEGGSRGDRHDPHPTRDAEVFHSVYNVTSANATAVAPKRGEYRALKAAMDGVSVFAMRPRAEGIAVYDVRPGLIATEMTAPVIESFRARAADGLTMAPRVGEPEEAVRLIATLAGGGLPWTTGQVGAVDGGMLVPRL